MLVFVEFGLGLDGGHLELQWLVACFLRLARADVVPDSGRVLVEDRHREVLGTETGWRRMPVGLRRLCT